MRQFIFNEDYIDADDDRQGLFIPGMLKLIQDHKKMLDAQQAQIDGLKARVEALEANQNTTE